MKRKNDTAKDSGDKTIIQLHENSELIEKSPKRMKPIKPKVDSIVAKIFKKKSVIEIIWLYHKF